MSRVKVCIIMACWLALALSGLAQQQAIYQHRLPLPGGGVVWDLGMATRNDPNDLTHDPVWAACDNNGIYRAHWDDENTRWSDWDEFLPGKWGNGVDVIVAPDENHTEHVLAATGNWGLFYETSTNGVFCPSVWSRPIDEQTYPDAWNNANIRDAAFYCRIETGYEQFPETPDDSIYVILGGQVGTNYPGLYYWKNTPTIGFTRFDELPSSTTPHTYDHFYRDLVDSNKIWVTSPKGIFVISGPYVHPKLEKLPAGTRLQDLPIARPPKNLSPLPTSK